MKMPWQKHIEDVCENHGDHRLPPPPAPVTPWGMVLLLLASIAMLVGAWLVGAGLGWILCWIKMYI